jgi:hypothetical protein
MFVSRSQSSDEFDNSNWVKLLLVVRGLLVQYLLWRFSIARGKIRMFRFNKSEYLEIENQMHLEETIRKDFRIPGIGGYLASVILAEIAEICAGLWERFGSTSD